MRHILATLVLAGALAASTSAALATTVDSTVPSGEENPFVLAGDSPSDYQVWQLWEMQNDHDDGSGL